jgi:hemoglobin/transferrin/lactoferrin receptor protein
MNRLLKRLTVIAMLAMCSVTASALPAASASGTVTDQNKAVIVGAAVKALNLASGRILSTTTNSSGEYLIEGLQPGSYRFSVSFHGFTTLVRNITLRSSERMTENFSLVQGAIEDSITVTAGKGNARAAVDTPQTVTIIDAAEIEKLRPQSTLEALERTPNLIPIASNPAAERPRLRGLNANRLLIIIDGERLNNVRSDPFSGVSPSIIDVTELESAEVVSGAGSSLYGSDALAGTINLVTKAPIRSDAGQYLSLRFDGDLHSNGLFRRGATTLSWSIPKIAVRASGSLFRSDNYHSGNEAISIEDVLSLGRFANSLGDAIGNNVALTYGVWQLPAKAEIPNGQGRGFNDQIDVWFYPSADHSIRYRQLNSQHKNIGVPLLTPPFDGRQQFIGFRRLDKNSFRYDGRELAGWLPHLAGGFYRQKYSFADDNYVSTIDEGSSWRIIQDPASPTGTRSVLTGNPSTFTLGNFTDGKNTVTSYGLELQGSFIPFAQAVITSGIGYLSDSSKDEFSRIDYRPGTLEPRKISTGGASNPNSVYKNLGWFNLLEYEPARWVRLLGGFRLDNWQTEARVTPKFPVGTESAILDASLDQLFNEPGQIDVEGLKGITDLISGTSGIRTDSTILTSNVGVVFRLPHRVNPYFRWATSYREPGITERYILRNFGDPTFSVLLVPNTKIRPERGKSYEAGVKVSGNRWSGSFGYFRNNFEDFLRLSFANPLFVPADPARGLEPLSPDFPFHGVLYAQRTNTARVRIQGVEAAYDVSVPLGRKGAITLFGTLGWLKGSDLTPDQQALILIEQFYNRSDTPIILKGSPDDAPLSSITPFRAIFGARYSSFEGKWFGEYRARYQSRVERVDPLDLSTNILTQYGMLASLNSLSKHSLRAGYIYKKERCQISLTFGIENLNNSLYFDHFQNAPGYGRSFVFGMTTNFLNLLRR